MHVAVLTKEVIEYLAPQPGQNFIDGTCGAGGHSLAILEKILPGGQLLCLDWDNDAIGRAQAKIAAKNAKWLQQVIFINDSYANLAKVIAQKKFGPVNGVLLDLGLSSDQLAVSGRGFSFLADEALDMRYSLANELTAAAIINQWDQVSLEKIFKEYGEERWAKKISQAIIKNRKQKPILTTTELVGVMTQAVPRKFQYGRTHFATRIFQALRIAVNDELGNLQRFLPQSLDSLENGGRAVIISFHSLEDRLVKNFFREQAKTGRVEILTKKPQVPSPQEIAQNPRSRSAKLRAIKKIS